MHRRLFDVGKRSAGDCEIVTWFTCNHITIQHPSRTYCAAFEECWRCKTVLHNTPLFINIKNSNPPSDSSKESLKTFTVFRWKRKKTRRKSCSNKSVIQFVRIFLGEWKAKRNQCRAGEPNTKRKIKEYPILRYCIIIPLFFFSLADFMLCVCPCACLRASNVKAVQKERRKQNQQKFRMQRSRLGGNWLKANICE